MRRKPIHDPAYAKYMLALAGKTQNDLAIELGITRSAVSQVLSGHAYSQRVWNAWKKHTRNIITRKAS